MHLLCSLPSQRWYMLDRHKNLVLLTSQFHFLNSRPIPSNQSMANSPPSYNIPAGSGEQIGNIFIFSTFRR